MTPHPTIAQLGRTVVRQRCVSAQHEKRVPVHRWFIWFPREVAWLSTAHLRDRGTRPWIVASQGAPRWA